MAVNKRKILESAQKHLQKGALDKALKEYTTLLKSDPRDVNVRLKVGDIHLKQGKTDEAVNAYLRVAESFMKDGFDAKAVALFKQITKIDSKRVDVYVPLAELYQRMGLTSDAMKALQTAADASYRNGAKDQALDLLRKMAALDPANTTSRLKVADLLRQEGRREEAIAEYDAVAEELERQGAEEERVRTLERILELDPNRAEALAAVARARLSAGDAAGAHALAKHFVEKHPGETDAHEILAQSCVAAGRAEEGREAYRRLAEIYRERGDEDKARDIMQRFAGGGALSVEATDQPILETDDDLAFDAEIPPGDLSLDAPEFSDPGFVGDQGLRLGAPIDGLEPAAEPKSAEDPKPGGGSLGNLPNLGEKQLSRPVAAPASTPEGDPDQLVAEAGVYLRYGKNERALESLRAVLAGHPDHLLGLEKLGEALVATGDAQAGVEALMRAGALARDAGDAGVLERVRERLTALDPDAAATLSGAAAPAVAEEGPGELDEFDLDVEEPAPAVARPAPDAAPAAQGDAGTEIEIDLDDEPSADELGAEAPGAGAAQEPTASGEIDVELDLDFDGDPPTEETAVPPLQAEEGAEESGGSTTTPEQIVEDLEEADFFFQQGMLSEARAVYERVIGVAPNHPQALLRLGEIEAKEREAGEAGNGEGTPASERAGSPAAPQADEPALQSRMDPDADEDFTIEEPVREATRPQAEITTPSFPDLSAEEPEPSSDSEPTVPSEGGGDFDLAAELSDALEDGDAPAGGPALAGTTEGEAFEQVFAAFKAGVQNTLDEGDYQAHYDLGIAYKEMGLLDDALGEFQQAMGSDERRLACLHMMGLCALDLNRCGDAKAHLEQALALPAIPEEQQVALRFDLGRACAAAGELERAREAFEAVRAVDPEFCDVAGHIAALDEQSGSGAGDDSDETFESFDDLLVDTETRPPVSAPEPEPSYESFDDLLEEPDEAEEPEDTGTAAATEVPAADDDDSPEPPPSKGRPRRKKISFV